MKLKITKSDFEKIKNNLAEKQAKLEDLGLKLGDAMSRSSSFPASNPEYAAVHLEIQNQQQSLDYLKNILEKYIVTNDDKISADVVGTYSLVTLRDENDNLTRYYIMPTGLKKNIGEEYFVASPESPVGKALFGHKLGDKIELILPSGKKILEIMILEKHL